PAKRPALIGRLLANHIQPVAAGVSTSIESADDPDAVCPSLTRPGVPDAFAQLLGDLARHCQSNCGILLPQASSNNSVASDESDQQLLMRGWPDSLAALHVGLDVVRAWPECVRLQAIALRHGRALVESFMRHGLPLLGRQFRCRSEPAVRLLKQIQLSTRQLQAVANTCKDRNDGPTSALVPPLRRTLETFIYRVRALVARHDCAAAFEPGQLKLKNIQGEEMDEIRRPEDYDVSSTSDEDEAAASRLVLVMLSNQSTRLIADLKRGLSTGLPAFEEDRVRHLLAEIDALFQQNREAIGEALADSNNAALTAQEKELRAGRSHNSIQLRQAVMERNKRCLLAYLYHRLVQLRRMRWELGPILPANVQLNARDEEINWFSGYNRMLAHYMQTTGFDLTVNRQPPKSLFVEVRCLQDYGQLETEDGCLVNLKKGSHHYLLHSDTELLVRQGVLEHVGSNH
uniref:DNA replication complex GINS protein PSF1 n=1 Tax=Macrostomum lignano TaxID=282301 RepID=A0A1I8G4F3_9PLAT